MRSQRSLTIPSVILFMMLGTGILIGLVVGEANCPIGGNNETCVCFYDDGEYLLAGCDMNQLNFEFLKEFGNLSALRLSATSNVHLANWESLPHLPNLNSLVILSSTGLNDWETFPSLIRGLEELLLSYNEIQNVAMNRILNWVVHHSASTLQYLYLDYNDLTRIPRQIPSFSALRSFAISNQERGIPTLNYRSIRFSGPVSYFFAGHNNISRIKPGAFHGDFSGAYVELSSNNLTRFEEIVFKEMLQQMVHTSSGYLSASKNLFDCELDLCHLAWLIRDNRHLLKPIEASCSNGTSFQQLNPDGFRECDIKTSLSTDITQSSTLSTSLETTMPIVTTPTSALTTSISNTTMSTSPDTNHTTPTSIATTPVSYMTTPTSQTVLHSYPGHL